MNFLNPFSEGSHMLGINVFFSYSHKDEEFRDELATHLRLFERIGTIKSWHDRLISGGSRWKNEIDSHIYSADIILALVSSDFLASEYCYDIELERALFQYNCGRSALIPIIVRPVIWSTSSLSMLQALPTDAKPVTSWGNRDLAWKNVTEGILKVVVTIRQRKDSFLETVPSIFYNFIESRSPITTSDDSAIKRNVDRLSNKEPDIWHKVDNYNRKVITYSENFSDKLDSLYTYAYGIRSDLHDSFKSTGSAGVINDLAQGLMDCLTMELDIRNDLLDKDIKPSLFGFPGSDAEVMQDMATCSKVMLNSLSTGSQSFLELDRSVIKPIQDIWEKQRGEDFEEV